MRKRRRSFSPSIVGVFTWNLAHADARNESAQDSGDYELDTDVEHSANESGSNDEFSAYERNDAYEYDYVLDVVGSGSVGTYAETALETTSRTFDGTYTGGGTISDSSLITLGFTNSGTVSPASGELAFSSVRIAEGAFPDLPPILEGFDFSSSGGAPSAPSFGGGMDGPSAGGGGGVGGSNGGDSGGQQGGGPKGPGGGDGGQQSGGKGPDGGGDAGSKGDGSGPQVPGKIFVTADGKTGGDEPPPTPPRPPGAPQRRESGWQFRRWLDKTQLGRFAGHVYDGAVEVPLVVWDLGQAVYAGVSGDYDIEWRSMTGSGQSDAFDHGGRDGGRQVIWSYVTGESARESFKALGEGDSKAWGNTLGMSIFLWGVGRIPLPRPGGTATVVGGGGGSGGGTIINLPDGTLGIVTKSGVVNPLSPNVGGIASGAGLGKISIPAIAVGGTTAMATVPSDAGGNPATSRLRDDELEDLANQLRNGTIKSKDLKKRGILLEDIEEIEKRAKENRPRDHDANKIIDTIEGSKRALDEAIERVRRHPNDPEALKTLEQAQKQYDEIMRAKAASDRVRRSRNQQNK